MTERVLSSEWQHEAARRLHNALQIVTPDPDQLPTRVALRQWFSDFASLRNKTRAHGATTPALCAKLCPDLEQSIKLVMDNLPVLQKPWAYLHRNLSGKYRVVALGGDMRSFSELKSSVGATTLHYRNLTDGVYIDIGDLVRVALIETSVDVADFFFPNGAFKGKAFELLS